MIVNKDIQQIKNIRRFSRMSKDHPAQTIKLRTILYAIIFNYSDILNLTILSVVPLFDKVIIKK